MAIDRPEAIGAASGTDRSGAEDAARRTLLVREECAQAQGKKVRRAALRPDDRGAAGFRTDQAERGRGGPRAMTEERRRVACRRHFQGTAVAPDGQISLGVCRRRLNKRLNRSLLRDAALTLVFIGDGRPPNSKPDEARTRPANAGEDRRRDPSGQDRPRTCSTRKTAGAAARIEPARRQRAAQWIRTEAPAASRATSTGAAFRSDGEDWRPTRRREASRPGRRPCAGGRHSSWSRQ